MIRDGDFFTVYDLRASVAQVTSVDMRKYLKNTGFCRPDEYAQKQMALYGDIKSSAAALDKQLKDAGFKTKYKFSYKYNIPGLTSEDIVQDAYKLEYFYLLAIGEIQGSVRPGQQANVDKMLNDAARISYYYAQYVWKLNPESRFDYALRFDVQRDWGFVICFLLGVGFGFHPKDVYEFVINHNNPYLSQKQRDELYKKQLVFKNWCQNKFDIDTGCLVFCPEHQEKLRKILTKSDTPYLVQCVQDIIQRFCPQKIR